MKDLKIEITLLSPLQLGSGHADVIIDSEAAHDRFGMPYFPAKRFKGLLYESALEMSEISNGCWFSKEQVDILFGRCGTEESGLRIDNLCLKNYEKLCDEWSYLENKYPSVFSCKSVWQSYTDVRFQTAIDKNTGTTVEGSLHNMRVVDAGLKFYGNITLATDSEIDMDIIQKALLNLRFAGAKRNRGCGRIKCRLIK